MGVPERGRDVPRVLAGMAPVSLLTSEQMSRVSETELRAGEDMYNRGVGHLILPSGQTIAVWQGDNEMASALVSAWWDAWQDFLA